MVNNPHQLLGVSEKATQEEIKRAYRELAKKYHPDTNPGNAHAEKVFKELNEAYSILSDEAKEKVEELRTEDRSKVKLSDSVRKRVSEGIQFIYSNANSGEMASVTDSIAGDLMTAISANDAMAIDISTLKTSDEYTFKHSVDVATISMVLAKQQGLSKQEIYEIGVAGLLHDVGKTILAVFLVHLLFPESAFLHILAGVASVYGHIFPFYLKFNAR